MSTPNTPSTPNDHTLADEVLVDEAGAAETPSDHTVAPTEPTASAPATVTASPTAAAPAPEQTWLRGPAPFAVILGILGLVVAGAVLLGELTDLTLPWTDLGPWSVVAAGLVVLLVGAIGLRSSRTRG